MTLDTLFEKMQEDVAMSHTLSDSYLSQLEDIMFQEIEKRKVDVYVSIGDDDDERTKLIGTYNIFDLQETNFDSAFYAKDCVFKFEQNNN